MQAIDAGYGVIVLLGAVHGLNPAMGWLFAVSLGLQESSGRAVWRALAPLAAGHALAVAAALFFAAALGIVLPLAWVRWLAAAALLAFGAFNLLRHRHPRLAGMRVSAKDLALWSFLMASAHGAGLMVVPFVLRDAGGQNVHEAATMLKGAHALHATSALAGFASNEWLITLVHTGSYLVVAGTIAFVVYWKLGLRLLRTAWININVIWAIALIVTALLTPLL